MKDHKEIFGDFITAGTSDLSVFEGKNYKLPGAFVFFCREGEADIRINIQDYRIKKNELMMPMPGNVISLISAGEGFSGWFVFIPGDDIREVTQTIPSDFFGYIHQQPVVGMSESLKRIYGPWRQAFDEVLSDTGNIYSGNIIMSLLRCLFWELADKTRECFTDQNGQSNSRSRELFHRFMTMLQNLCPKHRDVEFYAGELCISPRYLSYICAAECHGKSAKKIIDEHTVLYIKATLESSDKPLQEIAEEMNFSDQSYLARYFARQTGIPPMKYRKMSGI